MNNDHPAHGAPTQEIPDSTPLSQVPFSERCRRVRAQARAEIASELEEIRLKGKAELAEQALLREGEIEDARLRVQRAGRRTAFGSSLVAALTVVSALVFGLRSPDLGTDVTSDEAWPNLGATLWSAVPAPLEAQAERQIADSPAPAARPAPRPAAPRPSVDPSASSLPCSPDPYDPLNFCL